MAADKDLYRVVDYILNHAAARDLEVIKAALERRERDARSRISPANIRGMAKNVAESVARQLESIGDVKEIAKRYVRSMVRNVAPDIPEEHLDLLLDEWIPSREPRVSEDQLPRDVVTSMVVQFVDYSLGRMSEEDKAQLAPDWSRRYWAVFSERTRRLLRDFLLGATSEEQFWAEFKKGDS